MSAPKHQQNQQKKDELPVREQAFFKALCDHFEKKNYKKAMRSAEQILESFPNNGDTISMKGLVIYSNPESKKERENYKQEALDLIKQGLLKSGFKSHICWHVYGLFHRGEKNWVEAVRCYKKAVELQPDNEALMRDLANMQAHVRDVKGLLETRRKLLGMKPSVNMNWTQLAVAADLAGEKAMAVDVLSRHLEMLATNARTQRALEEEDEKSPKRDSEGKLPHPEAKRNARLAERYETSELVLYRADLLQQLGSHRQALEWLEQNDTRIADKLQLRERKARLLELMGEPQKARAIWEQLSKVNPDQKQYHEAVERILGLKDGSVELMKHREAVLVTYPKSQLLQVRALEAIPLPAESAKYHDACKQLLTASFTRGVPTMFQTLKQGLRTNPARAQLCEQVAQEILKESSSLPLCFIWSSHFLAQILSMIKCDYDNALSLVDSAIKHTPTLPDLFALKAKILARSGDFVAAAKFYERARTMDTADRYLNARAAKYHLRAGQPDKASEVISLFLKEGPDAPQVQSKLSEMQCMVFENETGKCYAKLGENGRALKRFVSMEKHFEEMVEDQFDFHYFNFRKATLQAYLALLNYEDTIHSANKFYPHAAINAVRTLLAIDTDHKQNPTKKPAASTTVSVVDGKKGEVDQDLDGVKLLEEITDPLKEAAKRIEILEKAKATSCRLDVRLLGFEVYLRQLCFDNALTELKKITEIKPNSPESLRCSIRLYHAVEKATDLSAELRKKLEDERATFFGKDASAKLSAVIEPFFQKSSLSWVAAAALSMSLVDPATKDRCMQAVLAFPTTADKSACCLGEYSEVFEMVKDVLFVGEKLVELSNKWAAVFPHANCFMTKEKLAETAAQTDAAIAALRGEETKPEAK